MTDKLSHSDISTIKMALMAWAIRCDREEREMLSLASAYGKSMNLESSRDNKSKCEANAKASRQFATEARDLLGRI